MDATEIPVLPKEIVIRILKYLPLDSRIRCESVNLTWRELLRKDIWKETKTLVWSQKFIRLLNPPSLVDLSVWPKKQQAVFLSIFRRCATFLNVLEISFPCPRMSSNLLQEIILILRRSNSRLVRLKLELHKRKQQEDRLVPLERMLLIACSASLVDMELNVDLCCMMQSRLQPLLEAWPILVSLKLYNASLSRECFYILSTQFASTLQTLHVRLQMQSMSWMSAYMSQFTELRELSFLVERSHIYPNETVFEPFFKAMSCMPKLKALGLLRMKDSVLEHGLRSLLVDGCKRLEVLDLHWAKRLGNELLLSVLLERYKSLLDSEIEAIPPLRVYVAKTAIKPQAIEELNALLPSRVTIVASPYAGFPNNFPKT